MGQDDMPDRLPGTGAQIGCGVFEPAVERQDPGTNDQCCDGDGEGGDAGHERRHTKPEARDRIKQQQRGADHRLGHDQQDVGETREQPPRQRIRMSYPLARRLLSGLTYILLIVPETVIGTSLLLFYSVTRFRLGMPTLVAGITPLAIAVTALIVRAGVLTLDRRLEDAAADLGAGPWQTIWHVVLPHLAPAVLAGALMSYVFSF